MEPDGDVAYFIWQLRPQRQCAEAELIGTVSYARMLPWLLAAVALAAVVLMAPLLGRHLFEVFDGRPQPAWDRWLNPIEDALLRWIGDAGRSAESAAGYLAPLLISNALFALPLAPAAAWAQADAYLGSGFLAGFLHSISGVDHLLLLVGIGAAASCISAQLLLWALAGAIGGGVF